MLFLCVSEVSVSQEDLGFLSKADSLFENKKYTEALAVYEQILEDEEQYSTQMLLKMAYINEGLGDYANALYFLENYYNKTSDLAALAKIKEITEQEGLGGYQYDDLGFVIRFLTRYKLVIFLGLVLVVLLLFGHLLWSKLKIGRLPKVSFALLILVLVTAVVFVNISLSPKEGVVVAKNAFALLEPSAASDVQMTFDKGKKVKIKSVGDIWTEVEIEDQLLYVRSNKLGFLF